jgi:hypothetical protein
MNWTEITIFLTTIIFLLGGIAALINTRFNGIENKQVSNEARQEERHKESITAYIDLTKEVASISSQTITFEGCVINSRALETKITTAVENKVTALEIVVDDKINSLEDKVDANDVRTVKRFEAIESRLK